MPWCNNCQKPIQLVGLCRPCEQETLALGDMFDEDEITEVTVHAIIPVGEPEDICGCCRGTGEWGGPNSGIGCPACLGTGRVQ